MNLNVVGLDIAKLVFHMFMMQDGKAKKKKLKRSELLAFVAQMPVSVIAMEACGGAHHWARAFQALGHEVVLLNTRFVKAFVVGNKTITTTPRRFTRRPASRTNAAWRSRH
ncbi:hypothetical protein Q9L42_016280 [Methylomarinum sp. Ch1-1]|uniref:Transposase n=1 Tax=Methylomarinum roseum TaxID=3067653 RepID=A0AAU7NSB9_9GAMM